ncbi:MAG: pseudouridine synthase [Patescibacteria group bacterium]|nr:pseudouridine synthase [Patescibacteria group bacterium]
MPRKYGKPKGNPKEDSEEPRYPMRVNKYLAWKNYGTRREGDSLVEKGRVLINGARAKLGDKVHETDIVEVRFHAKKYRYFAYNRPRSTSTTFSSYGKDEVADTSSPISGTFPIGQLDKYSHGLVILTDDGRITDRILHPDYSIEKEYIVTTKEILPTNFKKRLERGVNIEGYMTQPCQVTILGKKQFSIILTEDKKHQIRRMCAALNHVTDTIERYRIANITTSGIGTGKYCPIEGAELDTLLDALGI